ncbi:hypothetical protein PVT68_13510 [Microbulbifer bruguierae]|uniref:Uncharacterized protein n=1 Tax=Microbulbifer bruguierae TaxID=3029061 RepID=A0ABY8NBJ8_9GAMM|nr:hypothetical protein [Microbulbifer bruguierae]WGL15784.1 hypothetical protein PVT68_13510 [Microbulbifer bruguierae]
MPDCDSITPFVPPEEELVLPPEDDELLDELVLPPEELLLEELLEEEDELELEELPPFAGGIVSLELPPPHAVSSADKATAASGINCLFNMKTPQKPKGHLITRASHPAPGSELVRAASRFTLQHSFFFPKPKKPRKRGNKWQRYIL